MNFEEENKDLLNKDENDWTIFDWIRFLCGKETLVKIRKSYSGFELKVPSRVDTTNEVWTDLVKNLGHDKAKCFAENFGGEVLYIPFGKQQKKHVIADLIKQGLRNNDIARRCEVSERYVRMVKCQVASLAT